jgi:asparaginyl-tRNA synthetase
MSLIYVDETGGSDSTGQGNLEKPYQSLAQSIYAHGHGLFRIRKNPDAEYEEPTPTSLKKAKKNAQGIGEKKKKEEKKAKKKAEEKENRENLLQKSQTIVVEENPALPTATRVSNRMLSAWYC